MRVLVVEDEVKMGGLLRRGLQEEGHAADVARTGDDALWMAAAVEYDAIVLDVMLPGRDGFEVCRDAARARRLGAGADAHRPHRRRATASPGSTPARTTTCRSRSRSRELLARLRALARRGAPERPSVLEAGDLRLDPCDAARSGAARPRSRSRPKEFALLETFMRRPGRGALALPAARARLGLRLREQRSNVVDVYVRYLREKIDRPFGRESIETVRGVGYRLRAEAS